MFYYHFGLFFLAFGGGVSIGIAIRYWLLARSVTISQARSYGKTKKYAQYPSLLAKMKGERGLVFSIILFSISWIPILIFTISQETFTLPTVIDILFFSGVLILSIPLGIFVLWLFLPVVFVIVLYQSIGLTYWENNGWYIPGNLPFSIQMNKGDENFTQWELVSTPLSWSLFMPPVVIRPLKTQEHSVPSTLPWLFQVFPGQVKKIINLEEVGKKAHGTKPTYLLLNLESFVKITDETKP